MFKIISMALLILTGVLAYQNKDAAAFVTVVASGLSAAFGNISIISEISASANSLTLKIREASDVLKGLRRLAATMGFALTDLYESMGAVGIDGMPAEKRDDIRAKIDGVLEEIGISHADKEQETKRRRAIDIRDYRMGLSAIPHTGPRNFDGPLSYRHDFEEKFKGNLLPDPDEILALQQKYGVSDPVSKKILHHYREFLQTGQHTDPDFWAARGEWVRSRKPVQ